MFHQRKPETYPFLPLYIMQANSVLYNFRLLSALRSDDPAQVQPFLEEAKTGGTGELLGTAVKVGTSRLTHQPR